MNYPMQKPNLCAGKDAPSLYCWFVEEDGTGHQGYAAMDGRMGSAPSRGGGLFPTIEDVRDAIRHQTIPNPWLIPYCPASTPKGWRIRGLTTNEVERLGLAPNTVLWNKP